MDNIIKPQVGELLEKYNPDIWQFDGDWACITKYSNRIIDEFFDKIHIKCPHALINDRLGRYSEKKKSFLDTNFLGKANYRIYADRQIPDQVPLVRWKYINTIGLSCGRN